EAKGIANVNVALGCVGASSAGCTLSGTVSSVYEVRFALPDIEAYQFSGNSVQDGHMYLEKVGVGHIFDVPPSFILDPTTSMGFLTPGSYILHADQTVPFGISNSEHFQCCGGDDPLNDYKLSFQLNFVALVVPEPSSLVAIAI